MAVRALIGFAETSTICARPSGPTCDKRFISAADRNHFSVGLIIIAEIVLLRFSIDHVEEELAQLVVARAGAHRFHDIEFQITAETRAQFSIASQAQFVAALAKMQVRHRANETDALIAS